jgi:hypothetical protein
MPKVSIDQPDEQAERGEVLDGHGGADLEPIDRHEERGVHGGEAEHAEHREPGQLPPLDPEQVPPRQAEHDQQDQAGAGGAQLREPRRRRRHRAGSAPCCR